MFKRTALFAALAVAMLALSACGGSSGASGSAGGGPDYEPIVVYSNSVSDGRGQWLQAQAKQAGFEIQFVDIGGGDLMNRLVAEKANPVADVVFGLNQVYFEKLDGEGVLAASKPKWAGKVDTESFGNDSTYWPIVREPIMLVYNTEKFSGDTAPTDWPDLWMRKPFDGKYETPAELGGATTQMVLTGILSRYRDAGGEFGVAKKGWDAIAQFFAKGNRAVESEDLYARMASGAVGAGGMWLAGKAAREKQYGVTTEAAKPRIGVPMVAQSVAIVAGTKKATTAKAFLDWFGGAKTQAAWSNEFFTAPTNKDALPTASQDAIAQTDSFTAQEIDWEFVAENIDKWVEKITLEYLG